MAPPPPRQRDGNRIATVALAIVLVILTTALVVVVLSRLNSAPPSTSPSASSPSTQGTSLNTASPHDTPQSTPPSTNSTPKCSTCTYGGNVADSFYSVVVAANGDIITAGWTSSTDGDFPKQHEYDDAVVARFTPDGTLLWARTYGGNGYDAFCSVAVATNGDIITAGSTDSTDGDFPGRDDGRDAVIARFTPDGTLLWARTYGGNGYDHFYSVVVATNGDIIATGLISSTDEHSPALPGSKGAGIARFTSDGTLLWANTYGGDGSSVFYSVAVATNGDIIATGETSSTDGDFPSRGVNWDAVVIRLDSYGER
jgi:hypothetical protein